MDALKAAVLEGIHQAIVKPLVKLFTQLFNASLDERRLPVDGLPFTVHKSGDKINCSTYGPVSLTSIVLKTHEISLCDRIVN